MTKAPKKRRSATARRLYAAYGSNLCMAAMARRCPAARPVGSSIIRGARLVFRSVADVETHKGSSVPIGLWSITPECEQALDRYEGVKSGLYVKRKVLFDDGREALIYIMTRTGICQPWAGYLDTIREGYADFGLDERPLNAAVAHARRHEKLTADVWAHHQRRDPNRKVVEQTTGGDDERHV